MSESEPISDVSDPAPELPKKPRASRAARVDAPAAELGAAPVAPVVVTVECPFCAEEILPKAKKCKHCGEVLDAAMRRADEALNASRNAAPVYMNAGGGGGAAAAPGPAYQLRPWGHFVHIVLSLLTVGFWIPVWIILYACRNRNVYF